MSRTERLLADIERAFLALSAGELDDAATILERCRRIDRKHPDVVALAAALADAQGNSAEAMAQYRVLSELRPDDPLPRICIARIELRDLGDPDAALDTLEAAFDFIDEEDDLTEAIYVRTEALIERGDLAAARESLAELASSVIEDPELALDFGELALGAEDLEAAARWITIARTANEADHAHDDHDHDHDHADGHDHDHDHDDPAAAALAKKAFEADALHLLGRVHEAAERREAMVEAWLGVLRLDRELPDGEVTITEDELEKLAAATLAELPEAIRARLVNVPILIDDRPSDDVVTSDGLDPRLLGLFQGTPMTEDGGTPSVTNIVLYRKNLERFATDEQHLAEEIRITVLHETAHYFGLDDDDLEQLGLG